MNERIKELAEQCETKEIGYYFFDRERFAELIIKECANHILNTSDRYRKEYFAGKVMELIK